MRLARREQRLLGEFGGAGAEQLVQPDAVGDPVGVAAVVGRLAELGAAEQVAQRPELPVVAHRDDGVAVGAAEHLIGREVRVEVAHALRRGAGDEVVQRLVRRRRDRDVEQRHVDALPPAGALALVHRRKRRDGGVESGEQVRHRDAGAHRRAVRLPGHRHQPRHSLDDVVVARPRGVGSVLPEAGDRAVDQPRIVGREALVVEAVAGERAGAEVLDEDVGPAGEIADAGAALLGAEVGAHRLLAAVAAVEVGGVAAALALDEGRPPSAGVVAFGAFDLDHLGAKVGECLPGPGAGQDARHLDDPEAAEGPWLHPPRCPSMIFFNSA